MVGEVANIDGVIRTLNKRLANKNLNESDSFDIMFMLEDFAKALEGTVLDAEGKVLKEEYDKLVARYTEEKSQVKEKPFVITKDEIKALQSLMTLASDKIQKNAASVDIETINNKETEIGIQSTELLQKREQLAVADLAIFQGHDKWKYGDPEGTGWAEYNQLNAIEKNDISAEEQKKLNELQAEEKKYTDALMQATDLRVFIENSQKLLDQEKAELEVLKKQAVKAKTFEKYTQASEAHKERRKSLIEAKTIDYNKKLYTKLIKRVNSGGGSESEKEAKRHFLLRKAADTEWLTKANQNKKIFEPKDLEAIKKIKTNLKGVNRDKAETDSKRSTGAKIAFAFLALLLLGALLAPLIIFAAPVLGAVGLAVAGVSGIIALTTTTAIAVGATVIGVGAAAVVGVGLYGVSKAHEKSSFKEIINSPYSDKTKNSNLAIDGAKNAAETAKTKEEDERKNAIKAASDAIDANSKDILTQGAIIQMKEGKETVAPNNTPLNVREAAQKAFAIK